MTDQSSVSLSFNYPHPVNLTLLQVLSFLKAEFLLVLHTALPQNEEGYLLCGRASLVAQVVKHLPAMQEDLGLVSEEFHRQRSLACYGSWGCKEPGYGSWGCKESDMTEQLTLSLFKITFMW